jgi:hypothetical protein
MQKAFLLATLLGAILILAGCRTGTWHPSKDKSEWGRDHAECEQIIRDGIRENPESYDVVDEVKLIRSCMAKKGWRNK